MDTWLMSRTRTYVSALGSRPAPIFYSGVSGANFKARFEVFAHAIEQTPAFILRSASPCGLGSWLSPHRHRNDRLLPHTTALLITLRSGPMDFSNIL